MLASGIADDILDALCRGVAWTPPAAVWVQPHVGSPGAAGTGNQAAETDRQQATFAASSGGSIASSAPATWTGVAGSEDWTHFSAWSASTAGTFLFSGTVTANPLTAGDTATIDAGGLVVTLPVAT